MRKLNFSTHLIRDYYINDFGIDLRQYFQVKPMGANGDIAFIGHLDWHFNPQRKCDGLPARRYLLSDIPIDELGDVSQETHRNFIFSGIFYFLILVPQTLREMFGKDVEYAFYRCTGWPLVSAGLGGYLPPAEMLQEANLMPSEGERTNFHQMLSAVGPFMCEEIRRFFQGDDQKNLCESSYRKMIDSISDKSDEFLSRIEREASAFMNTFSDSSADFT